MKDIVQEHRAERDRLAQGDYVPREGLTLARRNIENDLITVILRPKRTGKSVFSLQLLQGIDFAYLNFDDERLLHVAYYDQLIKAIRQVYGENRGGQA